MLLLQERGRMTAGELAERLEVSERTILRDIDELSGAGVPVFAHRGRHGGFELVDGFVSGLGPAPAGMTETSRAHRRALLRISPEGRRLAAVTGRLPGLRVRTGDSDDLGRLAATCRISAVEDVVMDVLALAPHVEVIAPAEIRSAVAERAGRAATLHREPAGPSAGDSSVAARRPGPISRR